MGFRPLSGYFFLLKSSKAEYVYDIGFPSPLGVFLFIRTEDKNETDYNSFRPLSGSFFLLDEYFLQRINQTKFPSPLGVFLFICGCFDGMELNVKVSVPSRGLSFYSLDLNGMNTIDISFRPLSGSFFLLVKKIVLEENMSLFPSPLGVFLFIQ